MNLLLCFRLFFVHFSNIVGGGGSASLSLSFSKLNLCLDLRELTMLWLQIEESVLTHLEVVTNSAAQLGECSNTLLDLG